MRYPPSRVVVTLIAAAMAPLQEPVAAQALGDPPTDTLHLDLAEARTLALEQSPAFLAEVERLDAAAGAVREAGTWRFNPEAEAELPRRIEGAGPRDYELRVTQTVEWAGQRGLRVDAAEAGLGGARATVDEARRRTTSAVSEAFYTAVAADRRLEVAEDIYGLNERLLAAVEVQEREGEISAMEANFAEIEAARSLGRVLAARREARSAALELGRLLGVGPEAWVSAEQGAAGDLPTPSALRLDALLAAAESYRPDLTAKGHQVRRAESLARLARREAIPNVGVGALVTGGESQPATGVGLQLRLPLPLWNRNQGLVAQRVSDVRRIELERDAVSQRVRTEVADALQAYDIASEEEALLASRVLSPTRSNQELLDIAYREGEIDLPSLVLLRNQLLDAELGYWGAWLARSIAYTRLQTAIGRFDLDLGELPAGAVR